MRRRRNSWWEVCRFGSYWQGRKFVEPQDLEEGQPFRSHRFFRSGRKADRVLRAQCPPGTCLLHWTWEKGFRYVLDYRYAPGRKKSFYRKGGRRQR